MEWKLKIHQTEQSVTYEMCKNCYMIIGYYNQDMIQFKGTEEQLKLMGFVKIGEVPRLCITLVIQNITIPCYKGKIMLPNGEMVDLVVCLEEHGNDATFCFPYKCFEKISIDVKKQEVTLQANIDNLKSVIENSNKTYMGELLKDIQ